MSQQPTLDAMSADARVLYRTILRTAEPSAPALAEALNWPVRRVQQNLQVLHGLGLIKGADVARIHVEDPKVSVGRLVDRAEADLEAQRQRLVGLRESMESFDTEFRRGSQPVVPRPPPVEEVAPAMAPDVVTMLDRTSTGTVRQVTARVQTGTEHDPGVIRHRQESMSRGREVRTVFHLDVLADPVWRGWVQGRAEDGERQRFLEDIELQFVVFGRTGVLIEEGPQPQAYAFLIRVPVIVEVFIALFEEYWRRGEPAHRVDSSAQTKRLLELLAMGVKDEAIARHLGVGLRTVRRRVAGLMEENAVETRFQLGLAVGQRGLLD